MLNEFLKELGFKDVTEDYPIKFSECILGLDNIYPISNRFIKNEDSYITMLLVGKTYNLCYVKGIYRNEYKPSYVHFHFEIPEKYVEDAVIKMLNAAKRKYADLEKYIKSNNYE